MSSWIPYRGQPERKSPNGHPLPPAPNEKRRERALWSAGAIIGIGIIFFATIEKTFVCVFALIFCLLAWVVFMIALRDLRSHEQAAPETDVQRQAQDDDRHSPEPESDDQPAKPFHTYYGAGIGCSAVPVIIVIAFVAFSGVVYMTMTFGERSLITIGAVIVLGVIGAITFLAVQESRTGPNITPRKFTAKNLRYKMNRRNVTTQPPR